MVYKKMIYKNLILNSKIWSQLKIMVEKNKLPHAFILHGSEGAGKEAHAIEFAVLLNDRQQPNYIEKIMNFQYPNINLIIPLPREKTIHKKSDALNAISDKSLEALIKMKKEKMTSPYKKIYFEKGNGILINSIRDIKKNINIMNKKEYMIHIIFEAEKLCDPRIEPGNALLKILEEPPENNIFILVTSNKNKILDTIQSRCCDFYFPKLTDIEIKQYLESENITIKIELDLLIKLANNNIKSILHMITLGDNINSLKKDAIALIKNIINDSNWNGDVKKMEALFRKNKETFKIFIKLVIFILNDLEKIKNKKTNCVILKRINKVQNLNYASCINIIEQNYLELNKNLNPAIGLFSMAINMKKAMKIN